MILALLHGRLTFRIAVWVPARVPVAPMSLNLMIDQETARFLGTAGIALAGWFAAYQFNAIRDRQNKRRELRIQYLLEAYRRIESCANKPDAGRQEQENFESAVADIQLLGTRDQILKLHQFLQKHNAEGASVNMVLEIIRADLRKEMGLRGPIPPIEIFRFSVRK